MTKMISAHHSQFGGVFFFLMVGIAIFAALSFVVSASLRTGEGVANNLNIDKAVLDATAVNDFAQSVRNGVQQMKHSGVEESQIDFMPPSDAGYNVAPHTDKIFHPGGGAIGYVEVWGELDDSTQATATAWKFINNTVDGVGSATGTELLMTLIYVPEKICQQLNKTLTGSTTIPSVAVSVTDLLVTGALPLSAGNCPACEGKTALCINNSGVRGFYYVLDRG